MGVLTVSGFDEPVNSGVKGWLQIAFPHAAEKEDDRAHEDFGAVHPGTAFGERFKVPKVACLNTAAFCTPPANALPRIDFANGLNRYLAADRRSEVANLFELGSNRPSTSLKPTRGGV